jgi:hypothetical protein
LSNGALPPNIPFPPPAPPKPGKQFHPSVKKRKVRYSTGSQSTDVYDVSGRIIADLTRGSRGNVRGHNVVDITSGSFEKET